MFTVQNTHTQQALFRSLLSVCAQRMCGCVHVRWCNGECLNEEEKEGGRSGGRKVGRQSDGVNRKERTEGEEHYSEVKVRAGDTEGGLILAHSR